MPLYFFHLNFGGRIVPDDEGVELPNRSAARAEASAVIRGLSNPEVTGNPRRWASWFLQVADEEGQFLRLPIGYPALEIVAPDGQELHAEEPGLGPVRPATTVAARQGAASRGRLADFIRQISARRQRTTQLLEDNRLLRHELSSLCLVSEGIRVRASRLVSLARLTGSPANDIEACRIADNPAQRAHPYLVLLPDR
jgi:hypothetical protein